jgi:hypothetical protein
LADGLIDGYIVERGVGAPGDIIGAAAMSKSATTGDSGRKDVDYVDRAEEGQ